jgi:hypothetical protein
MTRAHATASVRAARLRGHRDGGLALRFALAVGSALCLIEALTATVPSPESRALVATPSQPTVITVAADARPAHRDQPPAAAQCPGRGDHRVRPAAGG